MGGSLCETVLIFMRTNLPTSACSSSHGILLPLLGPDEKIHGAKKLQRSLPMALLRSFQHASFLAIWTILAFIGFSNSALAADRAGSPTATPRIVDAMDEGNVIRLAGHTHPLAAPKYDRGAVEDSF